MNQYKKYLNSFFKLVETEQLQVSHRPILEYIADRYSGRQHSPNGYARLLLDYGKILSFLSVFRVLSNY